MSIWNIKESLNNAFQSMQESINPQFNNLNDILFGMHINPFETSMTLFTFIWLVIIFFGVIAWIVHILSNLDKYNSKTTIKKTFLIIIFAILGIWLILKSPWNDNYIPMDFSLIYIKNPDDVTGNTTVDKPSTWYTGEAVKWIYSSPLASDWTEYLTIGLESIFWEDPNDIPNLNPIYKSEDYPQYKKYLLWMNWMEGRYKDMWITNSYISNLDLYDINLSKSDKDSWIDKLSNSDFNSTSFWIFIDIIKNNEDKKRLWNIISDEKFNIDKPITYKAENYKFVSTKKDWARLDIILQTTNTDGETKYLLLPYYDFVSILTQWNYDNYPGIKAFLAEDNTNKEKTKNIPKDVKLTYKYLVRELYKLFPWLRDFEDNKTDTYTLDVYDPKESDPLTSINVDRLQYLVDFNVAYWKPEIYTEKYVVEDVKNRLKEISKYLATQQSNLKEYSLKKEKIDPSKRIYVEKKLDEMQDKINAKYGELWSKLIKDKTNNVSKIYAVNLQDIALTKLSFEMLWNGDRAEQNRKQRSHITLLETVLSDWEAVLTDKEKNTFKLLKKIKNIDNRVPSIKLENKNHLIGYTLQAVAQHKKDFEIVWGADKLILEYICNEEEPGEFQDKFLELKSRLAIDMDVKEIFDCSANNWKWIILDKEKFKEFWNKIINAYKARDLVKKVQIIPYLAKISTADSQVVNDLIYAFWKDNISATSDNAFLSKVLLFWKYKFISPFLYYKYLINDNIDKIPWIFINLKDIKWKVNVPDWTYDLKLGSRKSWYKELDIVNWNKYTKTVWLIPTTADILLLILFLLNQWLIIWVFIFLLSTYLILLKKD